MSVQSNTNSAFEHGHGVQMEPAPVNSTDELSALFDELRSEIRLITNSESAEEFPDPASIPNPRRRIVIRSMASYVEAIANALKGAALSSWSDESLSPAEQALAADHTYIMKEDGTAHVGVAKSTTSANLLFAFRIYAKAHQANFVLDRSRAGWQDLLAFIKVRDRLTHPKRFSDLSVSDEEIRRPFVHSTGSMNSSLTCWLTRLRLPIVSSEGASKRRSSQADCQTLPAETLSLSA